MKKIFLIIFFLIPFFNVNAKGDINLSSNSLNIEKDKTEIVTLNIVNVAGVIEVNSSDNNIAKADISKIFVDSYEKDTIDIIINAVNKGTATINIKLTDVATYDEEILDGVKSITVNIYDNNSSPNINNQPSADQLNSDKYNQRTNKHYIFSLAVSILGIVFIIFVGTVFFKNKKNRIKIILFFGLLCSFSKVDASQMKIHVIDYNDTFMGDSVIIEQNGHYLLMDVSLGDTNRVIEYLDKNNITNFDIYLSHYHGDHYGSGNGEKVIIPTYIEKIMNNKKYKIDKVYVPNPDNNSKFSLGNVSIKQVYGLINTCASNNNIELIKLNENSTFKIGDAIAKVIHFNPLASDENNSSLVTMITIDNTKFLTAGDIGSITENDILNKNIDIQADILKLSHHAVDDSNTIEFLNKVKPKYTFYQLGNETPNKFSSFARSIDTINRVSSIANLYSMRYNGTTIFKINDNHITVTTSRNYHNLTINYLDSDNNTVLLTKNNQFSNATNYYLYDDLKKLGYQYDYTKNSNIKLTDRLSIDKTINLYYKKIEVNDIFLNATSATMLVGDTFKLSASVTPFDAFDKKITYVSSDNNVATVDNSGLVKAINSGTVLITAKSTNGKEANCIVTVNNNFEIKSKDNNIVTITNKNIKIKLNNLQKMTLNDFKNIIVSSKEIVVKDSFNKKKINNNDILKTGFQLIIDNTFKIIVLGDVNSDGIISNFDYSKISSYLMKEIKLNYSEMLAADYNEDNKISALDYIKLKKTLIN